MSSVPVTAAPAGFPRSSVTTAPGGTVAVASEPPGASTGPSTGCATRRETLTFAALVPGLKICSVGVTPPPEVKPAIWSPVASADTPMESRPAESPLVASQTEPNISTCPAVTVQTMRAEASAGRAKASKIDVAWTPEPPGGASQRGPNISTCPAVTVQTMRAEASAGRAKASKIDVPWTRYPPGQSYPRSEEHTSELQ